MPHSKAPFASDVIHGPDITRNFLWASGTAHTTWDRGHCTKLTIGSNSNTASGDTYSKTATVTGYGGATSGYWATN
jgi:hypothetical protein